MHFPRPIHRWVSSHLNDTPKSTEQQIYLTSSWLYSDKSDFLPKMYTAPLNTDKMTVPSTPSWLLFMQCRRNSHSGLSQNPKRRRKSHHMQQQLVVFTNISSKENRLRVNIPLYTCSEKSRAILCFILRNSCVKENHPVVIPHLVVNLQHLRFNFNEAKISHVTRALY